MLGSHISRTTFSSSSSSSSFLLICSQEIQALQGLGGSRIRGATKRRRFKNCTTAPPKPSQSPSPVANDGMLIKETPIISQAIDEIPGKELVVADTPEEIKEDVDGESFHGDWLVVRRKKKGGKEKNKGVSLGRNKEMIGQSIIATTSSRKVEIPNKVTVNEGKVFSGTLLDTHHVVSSSSGPSMRNVKKRARKDGGHKKDNTRDTVHSINVTTMQLNKAKDVPLTSEATPWTRNSVSRIGSSSNGVTHDLQNEIGPGGPMKGFDLGTEIAISSNLLGSFVTQNKKGSNKGHKPPDLTGQQISNASILNDKLLEMGMMHVDRMEEEGQHELLQRSNSTVSTEAH
ncbi:hypothetical protein RIF29_15869 [Crotalaria pallida]|uniref:Uncharacterized protein n=1 Tax=Crotalaria pallida TaxID=3830 RepID=A0AAN9FJW3_CROPI